MTKIYLAKTGFNNWLPQEFPVKLIRECDHQESLRHFAEPGWSLVEITEGQYKGHRFFTLHNELKVTA